ncbi:hypothetical protein VNO77_27727 [Canavalia gladiata]|uniref:Uncharacterized protein n=1 Tax=Canavalia gladiata TaxID=3824 RepID=A0AAN9Q6R8_CANGL
MNRREQSEIGKERDFSEATDRGLASHSSSYEALLPKAQIGSIRMKLDLVMTYHHFQVTATMLCDGAGSLMVVEGSSAHISLVCVVYMRYKIGRCLLDSLGCVDFAAGSSEYKNEERDVMEMNQKPS